MASMTPVSGGKFRVSWNDSLGIRHRSILPEKAAKELFEKVCAIKLSESAGIDPKFGAASKNMKSMKFVDLATRYRDEHLVHTRAAENKCYVELLIRKWGEYRLAQISTGLVKPWVYGLLNSGEYEVSTVRKIVVYFKRVFHWGMELEIISQNPIARVVDDTLKARLSKVNRRTRTIPEDDFVEMVKEFPTWLKRVCVAGFYAGMREGEILALTLGSLDLSNRLIHLDADSTKEGDAKTIGIEQPLYDVLIEIISERPEIRKADRLFTGQNGNAINRFVFSRTFRACADKAGFEGFRFHDFRHSYVVRKRREGHDKSVIKAQTGHHTDSMFDWYNKVDTHELQAMAGYTEVGLEKIKAEGVALVEKARKEGVPLGVVQSLIGQLWRVAV